MTIRIVTDSACDVPATLAKQLNITIVPVYINIGEKSYLDGIELQRQEFYANLNTYTDYPTTAAPASGAFTKVYNKLANEGVTEILSIHIAASLSATYNAARLGAEAAEAVTVTLFDTQQITLGSGLLAILAAEAVIAGHTVPEIVAMLKARIARTRTFAMLDTLDSLRRSGRVSWAQFGLGALLQIKPVMLVYQGEISVVARVRTRKRALQHTIQELKQQMPFERLAIVHANALQAATTLFQQVSDLFPADQEPIIMDITPAIGTHVGTGAVGFSSVTAVSD